jgi:hypothetical protein
LWQGVNGVNNPCPSGFRLPTSIEIDAERLSWSNQNPIGAFGSALKLSLSGTRGTDGLLYSVGVYGSIWSSTVGSNNANSLDYYSTGGGNALLNTSFNLAGKPLVETPEDAVFTLNNSSLDVVWFPEINSIIKKHE